MLPFAVIQFKLGSRRGDPSWDLNQAAGENSPTRITVPMGRRSLPVGTALCCLLLLPGLNLAAGMPSQDLNQVAGEGSLAGIAVPVGSQLLPLGAVLLCFSLQL